MSDKDFPAQSPDSSKPILQATTLKGDQGDPGISIVPSYNALLIPCDFDDGNPDFTLAEVEFRLFEGKTEVGSQGTPNGWVISIISQIGCTASISDNLMIEVTAITQDSAYYIARLTKSGYSSLDYQMNVHRVHDGEQGIQGITGDTGLTGDTGAGGPTGTPGTGLVMIKKVIEVKLPYAAQASDAGGGWLNLNFGEAHGLAVGDQVLMSGPSYSGGEYSVETVVDTDNIEIDETWAGNEVVDLWDMHHFKQGGSRGAYDFDSFPDPQTVHFPNLVPIGGKLDQFAIIELVDYPFPQSSMYAGYAPYLQSGYNSYMSARNLRFIGNMWQADLYDNNRTDYQINFLKNNDVKRDLYISMTTAYGSTQWSAYSNAQFEFHLAYKFFDTAFTG